MSSRTRHYWSSRTGVGAGFFTTAVLGVIVGFVVVGQILYSGTLQYIREYGTLKAMGAKNSQVVKVILAQAMISATQTARQLVRPCATQPPYAGPVQALVTFDPQGYVRNVDMVRPSRVTVNGSCMAQRLRSFSTKPTAVYALT